jgi:hypothetical protein
LEQELAMSHNPSRSPWNADFPPVAIHAPRREVSTHPWFAGARSGDVDAAALLVADTCSGAVVDWLAELGHGSQPVLAAVLAQKAEGLNVLPEVLAHGLHLLLGWELDAQLVQVNVVNHVGRIGFNHLARPALFAGAVQPGRAYVLVDDFIGQGGTLANLRGHIIAGGGRVLGATVLTGNTASSVLRLEPGQLEELRDQHGSLEHWWQKHFGFGFDCLTHAEACFLLGHDDSAAVRAWITEQAGATPAGGT